MAQEAIHVPVAVVPRRSQRRPPVHSMPAGKQTRFDRPAASGHNEGDGADSDERPLRWGPVNLVRA